MSVCLTVIFQVSLCVSITFLEHPRIQFIWWVEVMICLFLPGSCFFTWHLSMIGSFTVEYVLQLLWRCCDYFEPWVVSCYLCGNESKVGLLDKKQVFQLIKAVCLSNFKAARVNSLENALFYLLYFQGWEYAKYLTFNNICLSLY